jgi:hypothetical protein
MSSPKKPRRGVERSEGSGIGPAYEGPELLTALLQRAGSPHGAEEVARRFAAAQAAGEERAAAIPALFPTEPRFAGPDEARRLYANLFGLWARVASGRGVSGDAPEVEAPPEPPELPERGAVPGDRLTPDVVEAVWKHLAALPPRSLRRERDRFESAQPELVAWLAKVDLPESGAAAAVDLAFESWAMLDQAFGDRLGTAGWRDLEELASEPPPLEADEPALAAYVAEQLDILADDDPAFSPTARAQVERAVAAAVGGLRRTLDPETRN